MGYILQLLSLYFISICFFFCVAFTRVTHTLQFYSLMWIYSCVHVHVYTTNSTEWLLCILNMEMLWHTLRFACGCMCVCVCMLWRQWWRYSLRLCIPSLSVKLYARLNSLFSKCTFTIYNTNKFKIYLSRKKVFFLISISIHTYRFCIEYQMSTSISFQFSYHVKYGKYLMLKLKRKNLSTIFFILCISRELNWKNLA